MTPGGINWRNFF
jgi:hypothetical protein